MAKKGLWGRQVVSPVGRLSFCSLDKPDASENGGNKYRAVLAVQLNTASYEKLKQEVLQLKVKAFGDANVHLPIGIGNDDPSLSKYDMFKGNAFIKASSSAERPPVLTNAQGARIDINQITSGQVLYPGCFARLVVTPYSYDRNATVRGISLSLGCVSFIRDGDRVGSQDPAALLATEAVSEAEISSLEEQMLARASEAGDDI